jgi:hypothetical protein
MTYYVHQTKHLPATFVKVEAENQTQAKIAYCKVKRLNPLLYADRLSVWDEDPSNIPF